MGRPLKYHWDRFISDEYPVGSIRSFHTAYFQLHPKDPNGTKLRARLHSSFRHWRSQDPSRSDIRALYRRHNGSDLAVRMERVPGNALSSVPDTKELTGEELAAKRQDLCDAYNALPKRGVLARLAPPVTPKHPLIKDLEWRVGFRPSPDHDLVYETPASHELCWEEGI